MGSIMLLWALVVLSASKVYCRAVDDGDNSVLSTQPERETYFDKRDWVLIPRPPPTKVKQSLGSPVELVCEVMGSPVPSVRWIQGDPAMDEVQSLEANSVVESSPDAMVRVRSTLVLEHMLLGDKTYTCVGSNGGSYVYASTLVHPEHQSKTLSDILIHKNHALSGPQKPKIVYSYTQFIDIMGSNVVLPCKAIGRPRPEIYWVDNNGAIITDRKRYKVLPNGDLLISDFKWDDMGLFNCVAQNSAGKDTISTFIYAAAKE